MAKQKDNGKTCPITRQQFLQKAKPLTLTIDGKSLVAAVKKFSTGSFGWFTNDKFVVEVDGVPIKVQPSISLVVVGSKEAD
ncbi:MAG TPA: hypothetical protein VH682_23000 [Gemmataceae bacterium]|jgi:hypothetical protein